MNLNPTPKPTFGNIDIQEEVERLNRQRRFLRNTDKTHYANALSVLE